MSTLAMPFPQHHTGFHREFQWQEPRHVEICRPRNDPEKIALPSIRQAFPELQLHVQQSVPSRTPSATSPVSGPSGVLTPPEYIHSPNQNKRRRLSFDDDRESTRPSQIPRLYASPPRVISRHQSPPISRPVPEPWTSSGRTSPYMKTNVMTSMRSPRALEFRERMEPRLSLPSLPQMDYERNVAMNRMRSMSRDDYVQEPVRQGISHMTGPPMDASVPAHYRAPSYEYAYHHPTRVQSLSLGSIHPMDRTPFAPSGYSHPFQETFMRIGELSMGMSMGGDNKQRKRRGNLPKETTDKLRAWFVAHLHHPYPTEDEKQELMRQTGLQMNQISNWFINARRRQLPTMVNNARAESEAMATRGGDSKVLPSTERTEYEHEGKRASEPLSDGEGSAYDEVDMDTLARRRSANMKRGSI